MRSDPDPAKCSATLLQNYARRRPPPPHYTQIGNYGVVPMSYLLLEQVHKAVLHLAKCGVLGYR